MTAGNVEFNVQRALETIDSKIDTGFSNVNTWTRLHELADQDAFNTLGNRIKPLEGVHSSIKYLTRTGVGAIVVVVLDTLWHHVPTWLAFLVRHT